MLKDAKREDLDDFKTQMDAIEMFKEMDKDGDGFVETKDLVMIMQMFGEKITEKDVDKIAIMNADFDPDNTEKFSLQTFVDKIGNYIENYGTEDEVYIFHNIPFHNNTKY